MVGSSALQFNVDDTVTVQLICVFVFAYAKSRFSHNKAQLKNLGKDVTSINFFKKLQSFHMDHMPRQMCQRVVKNPMQHV